MPDPVTYTQHGRIGVAVIDHPPVNALSHAVRAGLAEALERCAAQAHTGALLIVCRGRTFSAGADVREFGRPMQPPLLGELVARIEACAKPVVAAIHGTALGGGLEIALACHFRVALPEARLGFPEVKLGIIPGAGGTQRLPRLVSARLALSMIAEGREVGAPEALREGLLDELIQGPDLELAAIAFAERVLGEGRPVRRTSELPARLDEPQVFDEFRTMLARKQRGFIAPLEAVQAVRMAYELPFEDALRREHAMCVALLQGPQSRAQRHAFAAEREVAKIPGLTPETLPREVRRAAVIGSGVMGRGIAMCFANAGIAVVLVGRTGGSAEQALAAIAGSYAAQARRGSLSQDEAARRSALIAASRADEDLHEVDLVVEAVSEDLALKKEIFARLDRVCRPGAILVSNTSFLDLSELARATMRPADVAGMHFFNPANLMRLVENVRTASTAPEVIATLMVLGKRLGKVPVLVGAGEGFVANRMLSRRSREALFMLEEGATPAQVDQVLVEFGFPLGPFAVADLGGLDVVLATRRARRARLTEREQAADLLEQLTAAGRLGQKTGAGWYRYDDERRAQADPWVAELIARHSAARGIARRQIGAQEILERCLYAMINEGARLIGEGVVPRPHEIDVIWLHGLGFPAWRGGPMFYADQVGLPVIYQALTKYCERVGAEYFTPAPLLEQLAHEGRGFYSV
jgi:3-hydroxyacyl-CoA dehydrogenase